MCRSLAAEENNQQGPGVRRRVIRRIRIDPPAPTGTTEPGDGE